jgi:hypothetical protein
MVIRQFILHHSIFYGKGLHRISVPYPSRGDDFHFARTICDVQFLILMEYEQRVIVQFLFSDRLDGRHITGELNGVRPGRNDAHNALRPGQSSHEH